MLGEKFDYSKGVIRSRQFNDQKENENKTPHRKRKIKQHEPQQNPE